MLLSLEIVQSLKNCSQKCLVNNPWYHIELSSMKSYRDLCLEREKWENEERGTGGRDTYENEFKASSAVQGYTYNNAITLLVQQSL